MPTFLQPVTLPERCFLSEILLCAAFQRLLLESYTIEGKEIRETDEICGLEVEVADSVLSEDETERAGIPKDPDLVALLEDKTCPGTMNF